MHIFIFITVLFIRKPIILLKHIATSYIYVIKMSTSSNSNGVDVWLLRELGCRGLICCLEELPGKKDLIIDSTLMKLLDRLAQAATLRKHDVDKIFRQEELPPNSVCEQRVYLTRPTVDAIKLVAEHVTHHQQQYQQQLIQQQKYQHQQQQQIQLNELSKVVVLCVPRVTYAARSQLEEEGLCEGGLVTLRSYCPGFVPLDDDLLTMELPTFFRDAFIDGDTSSCAGVAQSLSVLRSLYGAPGRTLAHGRAAQSVISALNSLAAADDAAGAAKRKCEIGHLFVFDRDADLVTPLLTQLTYEGSLDEHFNIQAGVLETPKHLLATTQTDAASNNASTTPPPPAKLMLNNKDTIFASVRHKHFAGVATHLVRKAKDIQTKKEQSKTMTPAQMKNFVANDLKELQNQQNSISLHLSMCEAITKATKRDFESQLTTEHGLVTGVVPFSDANTYFEDCCARQMPSNACLRLLCLISLTQNSGLTIKEYETLSSQLVAACGYRYLITLFELRQAGLLTISESSATDTAPTLGMKSLRQAASNLISRDQVGTWRPLVKALKLIPDPDDIVELHNPSDMSYVFNGAYTPALPQLLLHCLTRGVNSIADSLRLLPGTTFTDGWDQETSDHVPPVIIVVILGGVTFAEVAAFRLVGLSTGNRIIVASTGTTSGNKIIQSITNGNSAISA